MGLIDSITGSINSFFDEAFKKGWLLYAVIGLAVLILLLILK